MITLAINCNLCDFSSSSSTLHEANCAPKMTGINAFVDEVVYAETALIDEFPGISSKQRTCPHILASRLAKCRTRKKVEKGEIPAN